MSEARTVARYPWLGDALQDDGVVVTANRRLARELSLAWGNMQLAGGRTTWLTPAIFPWQGWLARLLASADDPAAMRRRLDAAGSAMLWERCLARRMPEGVLGVNGVVRQAVTAWSRLCDWDVGVPALLSTASSEDEKAFAGAAADYVDLLETGNWTDGPGLAQHVLDAIEQGVIAPPSRVTMAGFDRRSPLADRLLETVSRRGCEVVLRDSPPPAATPEIAGFEDARSEMRAAGAWARQVLEEDPAARVAIVCAGLETTAERSVRCIREGLMPGWQLAGATPLKALEVSYGRRLSDYPAVAAALRLLRWTARGLSGAELSPLIMSPFFISGPEGSRERLELSLRELPDREWTPDGFAQAFGGESTEPAGTGFAELVGQVREIAEHADSQLPPSACIGIVDRLLADCGWPGDRSLDSVEYQLVNRWRELLNEFARLESVAPTLTLAEAIRRIEGLAADTLWQPEAEPGIVQVLGPLEAAGMSFDAVWIAGMDTGNWPPPSRPAPFISVELQRQRKMPDATPADTLDYARRTLRRLIGSAPRCVLGWSRVEDDTELIRSTLIDEFPTSDYPGPRDPGWFAAQLCGRQSVEQIDGDPIRPVERGERVRGGAYTIQRQYTEPLSAVAFGRFGVRRPEPFVTGLPPSMRGDIIHNALHTLLSDKPLLGDIRDWTAEDIGRRTGTAVDSALAAHARHADTVLARLIGFERERVRGILTAFLASEADRDPDIRVLHTELPLTFERDDLQLGFRIDRVDRLPDGRVLIIDYKTGAPRHFLKQSDELRDVQPVLYADAICERSGEPIGGLAFLNVDSRAITWKGALRDPDNDDDDFDDRLSAWFEVTRDAVRAFASGDVRINVLLTSAEARPLALLSRIEECRRDQ